VTRSTYIIQGINPSYRDPLARVVELLWQAHVVDDDGFPVMPARHEVTIHRPIAFAGKDAGELV